MDYTVYIVSARNPCKVSQHEKWVEAVAEVTETYLEDATIIGYIEASDGTPWSAISWNRDKTGLKHRSIRNFDPKNLPKEVKVLQMVG